MGTRADFYVGTGNNAEWLGSIAWDGSPDSIPDSIRFAYREDVYRLAVLRFLQEREDGTLPEHGWPWPWEDSGLTDFAYTFDGGVVLATAGYKWFDARRDPIDSDFEGPKKVIFPNMKGVMKITLGPRSGLMVFSVSK